MSGIPERTLYGVLTGEVLHPRIDTVQAIERALGLSDNPEDYAENGVTRWTEDEIRLLEIYEKMNPEKRNILLGIAELLLNNL